VATTGNIFYSQYRHYSGTTLTNVANVRTTGTSSYASTTSNLAANGGNSLTTFIYDIPAGSIITNVYATASFRSVSGILLSQSLDIHYYACALNRETDAISYYGGAWIHGGTSTGAWNARPINTTALNGINTNIQSPGLLIQLANNGGGTSYKIGLAAVYVNITYTPAPQKSRSLYLGGEQAQKLYVGNTTVQQACLDNAVVFECE